MLWNGYKTYDIAEVNTANVDLTYQKPGETYYVSLKSDVPLLVYVINFNEANKLLDTDSIPKYDKFNNKIIYQKFAPVLKMERVYDNTGSFTVKDLGKYVVVVDARLTESDTTKTNNEMHKYELIVEKAQ